MTLTTTERLTLDGLDLKTLAWNIDSTGALLTGAGKRGANAPTAGRSGAIWGGAKPHEEGSFVLKGWVAGCDASGGIPSGSTSRREFYDRVDQLASVFGGAGLIRVQHTLPDGSQRRCDAEVRDAVSFDTFGANPTGRWSVEMTIPDAFWEDPLALVAANTGAMSSVFAGATAPMEDGAFKITGPITNPLVTDQNGSSRFQYNAVVSPGQSITVNSDTWKISSTSGTIDYRKVVISGGNGRLIKLAPGKGGTMGYAALLTGSGTSSVTALETTGRRKYMNG